MPPRHPLLAAALSSLIVLAASSARADSIAATARISNISWELVDLDLNDGVTSAITFTDKLDSRSLYFTGDSDVVEEDRINAHGSTGVTRGFGFARSTSSANFYESSAAFDLNTQLQQGFATATSNQLGFVLTPRTRLTVTTTLFVDAGSPRAADNPLNATALARSSLIFGTDAWIDTAFSQVLGLASGTQTEDLAGTITSRDEQVWGDWRFETNASAMIYSNAAPIPEPAAYAMLLAGCAVVGVGARRRRRSAA